MTSNEPFLSRVFKSEMAVLVVKIYVPVEYGASSFKCVFEIIEDDKVTRREATGVDSIQALLLAMIKLGSLLYSKALIDISSLVWLDARERGYLGLPLFLKDQDLLPIKPEMTIVI